MRYVEVDGLRTSVIGLGTWQFGSREWGYGETYAAEVAPRLVARAVELGITMIDTAEAYGFGRSERIVAGALAAVPAGERAGLTVATKFLPIAPAEPTLAWQAAGSRRRLASEAIDLYYAHWPNPFVSVRRTMQSMRPLVTAGLVRRVAVSNYDLGQWREAERALRRPVVANQVSFSLAVPRAGSDLVPYAAAAGRLVVAYSPLAQGLLAALAPGDGPPTGLPARRRAGVRAMNPFSRPRARHLAEPLLAAVGEIAGRHGATPAQVALAWVIGHPATIAIPGARTVEQLEENAAAADLELDPDDHARLATAAAAFATALKA